ncbi:MAG TPA: substrate-binding domain-containing protein [Symbiobacteriaceae bacterium]|nr:substrate-binding domain-containing protein [Symbiobacteriaceae bacterium]
MKAEGSLHNTLRQMRTRAGLSQQDLAALAGVTRQTVGGIEAGQFAPSATVALRLARALGCRVEDLFWLEDEAPELEAAPAGDLPGNQPGRVTLARVGGRWVAHPLVGEGAFRTELVPADGIATPGSNGMLRVRLIDTVENLQQTVVLAGCSPALSLWARAAERWHPGLRVPWVFANSMDGLHRLARGEVHGAGLHLCDPATGEYNTPFVRRELAGRQAVLINLGVWEEGLLVAPGNPHAIRSVSDLARPGVTIINREAGAGSRQLLEQEACKAGLDVCSLRGYDRELGSHTDVARAVAAGQATACISTASVALAFGLEFVPLRKVRYDMAFLRESIAEGPVRQLLGTLGHRWVRSQLETLGGYDTSQTGDVVAET